MRFLVFAVVLLSPTVAFAYLGPGAGISAFGSLFSLFAGACLAVVGFIWYPVKRLLRGRRPKAATRAPEVE